MAGVLKVGQPTISRILHQLGIARPWRARGAQHGNWKGGRHTTNNGYILLWTDDTDALACMRDGMGYILEHRAVMARALGRPLTRTETVHHINGDRADNRIENLQLRAESHGKGAAWTCRDCGSANVVAVRI
mgnify:CR=1 FL=1